MELFSKSILQEKTEQNFYIDNILEKEVLEREVAAVNINKKAKNWYISKSIPHDTHFNNKAMKCYVVLKRYLKSARTLKCWLVFSKLSFTKIIGGVRNNQRGFWYND